LPREVGWKFVFNGRFESYKKMIDAFAEFGIKHLDGLVNAGMVTMFYSVVDLRVPGRRYTNSTAFERELYFHCATISKRDKRYLWHIYPDSRSTKTKGYKLAHLMSRGMVKAGAVRPWPARRLYWRDSRDLHALQVSDIVAGAIAFYLNGHYHHPDANTDKKKLCDYVLDKFKIRTNIDKKTSSKGYGPLVLKFRQHLNPPGPATLGRQSRPQN
jgi:hypothetical protein